MATTATQQKPTSGRKSASKASITTEGDPLDIAPRLYKQLDRLLDDMEAADRDERMTMPQRITGMIALGRIMKMMQDIRKGEFSAGGGSAINRYAAAFATPDAVGGGDENTRPRVIVQFDRGPEADEDELRDEFDA
jgi:hypothetical protein